MKHTTFETPLLLMMNPSKIIGRQPVGQRQVIGIKNLMKYILGDILQISTARVVVADLGI